MFESIRKQHKIVESTYRSFSFIANDLLRKLFRVKYTYTYLSGSKLQRSPDSNVIISLTSFPARINTVWMTVETLFRQTHAPSKIILVLSAKEFPEKQLPRRLQKQTKRGLDVLWVEDNIRSYKKLIPVRAKYPDHTIITVDDDVFYDRKLIERLLTVSKNNAKCVVGSRGKKMISTEGYRLPYNSWPSVKKYSRGEEIILTGVGGIVYPPRVLPEDLLLDQEAALTLAPTADDIYFWGVTVVSGIEIICLGNDKFFTTTKDNIETSLARQNVFRNENDRQLSNVIGHFKKYRSDFNKLF